MLRNNRVILILFSCLCFSISAECRALDSTRSVSYFNSFLTGALLGSPSSGIGFSASTIHGIRWKKASIGLGFGFDRFEEWSTIPVVIDASYKLLHWKNTSAGIGVDLGYAHPRHVDSEDDLLRYEEKTGKVIHPFITYEIRANDWMIYIRTGFKFQEIKYAEYPRWWVGTPTYSSDVKRDINRFSMSIGFGWH